MIHFYLSNGPKTELFMTVDLPSSLRRGEERETISFKTDIAPGAGSTAASAATMALRDALSKQLHALIEGIRREAYQQGARDRALRAKYFSRELRTGLDRGGCC